MMLSVKDLSDKIYEVADNQLSVYDFERWFRLGSRNFHRWAEDGLSSLVFDIEGALSEYHFAGASEAALIGLLKEAAATDDRR